MCFSIFFLLLPIPNRYLPASSFSSNISTLLCFPLVTILSTICDLFPFLVLFPLLYAFIVKFYRLDLPEIDWLCAKSKFIYSLLSAIYSPYSAFITISYDNPLSLFEYSALLIITILLSVSLT